MLDIFHNDAFGVIRLSVRMNDLPYVAGQVSSSGLFDSSGIDTLYVGIEMRAETLVMVGVTPRGGPGEVRKIDEGKLKLFPVPHYQRDDSLQADEVTGRRQFGTDGDLETVMFRLDMKGRYHYRDLDLTLEHQRVGAIKGIITDKTGGVLVNLFQEFNIAEPAPIVVGLDTPTTIVRDRLFDLVLRLENTLDVPYGGIDAWVGSTFWRKLINHKSVRETYLNTVQAQELRAAMPTSGDINETFEYGGITWRRYRTGRRGIDANRGAAFIADNEARFVIRGVPDLFMTRFAPADYIETVNTMGLPRYAKQFQYPNDKGIGLEFQMNPISLCTRPQTLLRAVCDPDVAP